MAGAAVETNLCHLRLFTMTAAPPLRGVSLNRAFPAARVCGRRTACQRTLACCYSTAMAGCDVMPPFFCHRPTFCDNSLLRYGLRAHCPLHTTYYCGFSDRAFRRWWCGSGVVSPLRHCGFATVRGGSLVVVLVALPFGYFVLFGFLHYLYAAPGVVLVFSAFRWQFFLPPYAVGLSFFAVLCCPAAQRAPSLPAAFPSCSIFAAYFCRFGFNGKHCRRRRTFTSTLMRRAAGAGVLVLYLLNIHLCLPVIVLHAMVLWLVLLLTIQNATPSNSV